MKQKKFAILSILFVLAVLLTSCIFDTDESALSSWLDDQGLPNSYQVQTLEIDGIVPVSAESYQNLAPRDANSIAYLGRSANISHDMVLDFMFDTLLFAKLKDADVAKSSIDFRLNSQFYGAKNFPKDSFPIQESMNVTVSWRLTRGMGESFLRSIVDIEDSTWRDSLIYWENDGSADTSYEISIGKKDSVVSLTLPSALIDSLRKKVTYCRLQLRLSAPEAQHVLRFYGPESSYGPQFRMTTETDSLTRTVTPYRAAEILENKEDCLDCPILHGGLYYDSLMVELPSEPILKKLAEFYGDEFPYNGGDKYDVRQAVVLAELTMFKDDSQGSNELGYPIQIVAGSFMDDADSVYHLNERYKLNKKLIDEKGHPNMVFYDGDSLSLQVTSGMRNFINKASDGRNFKFKMRMSLPVLSPKDSLYSDHIVVVDSAKKTTDTSYVFFNNFDLARYDFSESMKSPMRLKLWLASKRGDE